MQALTAILEAIFGADRVIPHLRGPGGDPGRRMRVWMDGPGALLHHTPDVVVLGLDAPGVWTMVEVKTLDVTASTHTHPVSSHS